MKSIGIKKLYYSISEVSKITDLEQYVLRYWESEFEQLKPQKNRAGNRVYTNRDIQLIIHIRKLLREERYTIEGAKQVLVDYKTDETGEQTVLPFGDGMDSAKPVLQQPVVKITDSKLKEDLQEVRSLLEDVLHKLN
ncbi:MAG: MerR family transcriptional regulator [Bacteroidota bacterium]|nr:MerR family transcriptional regulator [Bacteroidota bacterium]